MEIIFGKKTKKNFMVSLNPKEKYESIIFSQIKKKGKTIYEGYDDLCGLKTIHFKFKKIVFGFIGTGEKDKDNLNLLLEILKNSKKLSFFKKRTIIQICIHF